MKYTGPAENKVSKLSSPISASTLILSIFISCLGLFGLAAFTAQRRLKEIGIRKVMGASAINIVTMLSNDFLQLVGIALIIGCPIAWFAMDNWLQHFVYRTQLSWWIFALAGISAIIIAFLTVSYQSVTAAISNPVKSLRD